ncbi:unnamed protein product [Cuscuta epithymum]|uniref:Uncharacterized protein n=1 Tax=Cuscuta epithymum TaxID=186058 RepID=A0AAV0DMF9_9ASTE|nr:unnamed protein product [Cuscuta epithymum]
MTKSSIAGSCLLSEYQALVIALRRHSVNMGNLQRNRRKEIATSHPSLREGKGKGRAGSSSQSREDFDDGYQKRDEDAMSDEQLQQLLAQNDGRFFQQQNISESIDEEELEDDNVEEDEGGDGTHVTPDDEQELEDEGGPSQVGKKSKSPIIENNFTKRKDPTTDKWYASCDHCKEYSLELPANMGASKGILSPRTLWSM